jgi:predicted DNA binding CopG/RHH family protein
MKLKGKGKKGETVEVRTPTFKTEAEEAAWWDAHADLISDLLVKHGRRVLPKTKSITIRLPEEDLERAKKLARQRGMRYQPFLKSILHEALRKAGPASRV